MISSPLPVNEVERQRALDSYDILDSLPERSFDDLIEIASQICGTPAGLVSFVDKDRQWFKAKVGIETSETPRDHSFCAHALGKAEFLQVSDAREDERFSDNPLVTAGPMIRFYAGAPLITPEGYVLGTICVIDQVPRKLNAKQKATMESLARLVVDQLEIRKSNLDLGQKIAKVSDLNVMIERQHKQLLSNAKMISLAEMAGGMAHEINNPLAIILGKTEQLDHLLSGEEFDRARARMAVQKIADTGQRIHRIISGLIAFSRGGSGESLASVSVRSVVDEAVLSLGSKCRELKATIDVRPFDEAERVHCRPAQIIQSLVNLLNNSIDAVQDSELRQITVEVRPNGDVTELYVVDSGGGIPNELRHKVMQPFFTTKGPHRGTGLGLSVAKGMMESQGGNLIYLEDALQTTFVIQIKRVSISVKKVS